MKIVKKTLKIVASVVLWCIILLAALYAFTVLATNKEGSVGNLFGFTPMSVQSNSMDPTFSEGDLIVIKTCKTADLKEGDIITFWTLIDNQRVLNTHRISHIEADGNARRYTTKGDNNAIEDTHTIADGDIVGKYKFHLPFMGKVMDFLSTKLGFFLVIILPMLAFFIYQVYHLIMVSMKLKKAVALEEAEADGAKKAQENEEAQAALEEAKRLKAEAEALKAEALKLKGEAAPEKTEAEASEDTKSE